MKTYRLRFERPRRNDPRARTREFRVTLARITRERRPKNALHAQVLDEPLLWVSLAWKRPLATVHYAIGEQIACGKPIRDVMAFSRDRRNVECRRCLRATTRLALVFVAMVAMQTDPANADERDDDFGAGSPCAQEVPFSLVDGNVCAVWDVTFDPKVPYTLTELPPGRDSETRRRWVWKGEGARVSVIVDGAWSDGQRAAIASRLADFLAVLPPFVIRAFPDDPFYPVSLVTSDDFYGSKLDYVTPALGQWHMAVRANPALLEWGADFGTDKLARMEEILVHEVGHLLDHVYAHVSSPLFDTMDLGGGVVAGQSVWGHPRWSDTNEWATAMEADGARVSDYAERNNAEDFAESFAAWLALRASPRSGRHTIRFEKRRHIADTIPNRLRWFDAKLRQSSMSPDRRFLHHGHGRRD